VRESPICSHASWYNHGGNANHCIPSPRLCSLYNRIARTMRTFTD